MPYKASHKSPKRRKMLKKIHENKESWTPAAGMPPDPTETPRDAAQAEATDQPTNQEQPRRPQSHEAKRGQAAATRSDGRSPGDTGTRETHNANQPKTRDHPNARTTAAAEGNGAPAEEEQPTTKQRYKKQQHPNDTPTPKKAAPTPKNAAPTPKKNTPKREKDDPRRPTRHRHRGQSEHPLVVEIRDRHDKK